MDGSFPGGPFAAARTLHARVYALEYQRYSIYTVPQLKADVALCFEKARLIIGMSLCPLDGSTMTPRELFQ
jgi:hypothetical protein